MTPVLTAALAAVECLGENVGYPLASTFVSARNRGGPCREKRRVKRRDALNSFVNVSVGLESGPRLAGLPRFSERGQRGVVARSDAPNHGDEPCVAF